MVNTCHSIVLGQHGLLTLKLCVLCIEHLGLRGHHDHDRLGLRGHRLPHGHGGLHHRPHQRKQAFPRRLCESILCV